MFISNETANYTWADELDHTLHNCLYNGDVLVDEKPIRGAVRLLNLCQGMYGTVELNDGTYFIEPLNTANNENGSSSTATITPTASLLLHSRPHLLYKSAPANFNDQYPEETGHTGSTCRFIFLQRILFHSASLKPFSLIYSEIIAFCEKAVFEEQRKQHAHPEKKH
ncbi:hypothetical protein Tsp_09370 [Trichinella spiralis]|uniref:hypothetical protein n=1 Tax=Trichinella spiralis TaxID=6334 RepID=UPI0001EFCB20|nr:hypothetical protein Tsp_09370 [Trichinella spiralis]